LEADEEAVVVQVVLCPAIVPGRVLGRVGAGLIRRSR
jgi:hypothetical protein